MKNDPSKLKIGDRYEIPKEGSLGLMALGYKGIMMWRSEVLGREYDGKEIIGPIVQGSNLKIYSTKEKNEDEKK